MVRKIARVRLVKILFPDLPSAGLCVFPFWLGLKKPRGFLVEPPNPFPCRSYRGCLVLGLVVPRLRRPEDSSTDLCGGEELH